MQKKAVLSFIILMAFLSGGQHLPGAPVLDTSGALQKDTGFTGSDALLLLVDRIEKDDRIIYGTDPKLEREMDEQIRKEKEKEEKSWEMLQHMYIDNNDVKPRSPSQKNRPTQQ
jgi:hypothetical protein